jgi:hypothetical protein
MYGLLSTTTLPTPREVAPASVPPTLVPMTTVPTLVPMTAPDAFGPRSVGDVCRWFEKTHGGGPGRRGADVATAVMALLEEGETFTTTPRCSRRLSTKRRRRRPFLTRIGGDDVDGAWLYGPRASSRIVARALVTWPCTRSVAS